MLFETMVAAVVLIIGLLGAFLFLDTAVQTSWADRAKEGATSLAREITEDARSLAFSQVGPSTIVTQLQALPGLANQGAGATWQIKRRGITYTINASECSVDDRTDSYGQHDSTFCSDSSTQGTSDSQPTDFKRVTVDVSWSAQGRSPDVHEVALLSSAGQAVGLNATNLQVASPTVPGVGISGSVTQPQVTSSTVTGMTFSVTAPSGTTTIVWTVNGVVQSWSSTTSGSTWTSSTWNISGLSDGTYQVGAAAENGSGVIGAAVTIPVQLARSVPAAPTVNQYGYNTGAYISGTKSTVAEVQWQQNTELNVVGYHLYNPSGTLLCSTTNSTSNYSCTGGSAWCFNGWSCVDLSPPLPTNSNLTYKVAATYYDANHVLQEGPQTSVSLTGTPVKSFTFANSTGNTATNCSGTIKKDMLATYTPGTDVVVKPPVTFCSDAFSAGQQIESGGTATLYISAGSPGCTVNGALTLNGTFGTLSASTTVSGGASAAKYTLNFASGLLLTMNAGDRINLALSTSSCSKIPDVHFGSSTNPSAFVTSPVPISTPNAPTSLSVTGGSNTATLTWTASSGGSTPVSLYRIYRDGNNYGNRYDIASTSDCSGTTCTYVDPSHTTTHTYYVTAVGGTTAGSNMAESTQLGPATG
jgi:Tfp pilus assembly protein PilV